MISQSLLSWAIVASIVGIILSTIAVARRKSDGFVQATLAAVAPIVTFLIGGVLGRIQARSFHAALTRASEHLDVLWEADRLRENYALIEAPARIALWCGGAALCAAALAIAVTVRRARSGWARRMAVGKLAIAAALLVVTWRTAHLSDGALGEALDGAMHFASERGLAGCDALEVAFATAQAKQVPLDRDYPQAREMAQACIQDQIAHLDDPRTQELALAKAELYFSVTAHAFPQTASAQLLRSALLLDPAQRAEVERRAAKEGLQKREARAR